MRFKSAGLAAVCLGGLAMQARAVPAPIDSLALELARNGTTDYVIVVSDGAPAPVRFAAAELAGYLKRMSGATFPVAPTVRGEQRAIVVRTGLAVAGDAYQIVIHGDSLIIDGANARSVLFAAYRLLERLGCRWLAPQLEFYEGAAEYVPAIPTLTYAAAPGDAIERPAFALRKIDVEGGRSHDTESLRHIIDWMPKLGFNTLQIPLDHGGSGRVRWDRWRSALIPELDKRGLLLEVGGHGYQNFLNADMENGRLFEQHPDWFGKDAACRPSRARNIVFNTENPDAVAYLTANIVAYLKERPEIDIFDLWPPDGARWAECKDLVAGAPADRQARLVNHVAAQVRRVRPDVQLEMIAYANAKDPPQSVALDPSVLVDFCPIGQNFDVAIFDSAGANNALYVKAIHAWRDAFAGDIGYYAYYRRYAWRSLPVMLPNYMQADLKWYASVPVQAVSTYAEPGDWGTYEVNHYVLGHLAWQPDTDLRALLDGYLAARYGDHAVVAGEALAALEQTVRVFGSVAYSRPRGAAEIAAARNHLAKFKLRSTSNSSALNRLTLMLEFALRDLEIQELRARSANIDAQVQELVAFLKHNAAAGVFLLYGGDDLGRYRNHYKPRTDGGEQ